MSRGINEPVRCVVHRWDATGSHQDGTGHSSLAGNRLGEGNARRHWPAGCIVGARAQRLSSCAGYFYPTRAAQWPCRAAAELSRGKARPAIGRDYSRIASLRRAIRLRCLPPRLLHFIGEFHSYISRLGCAPATWQRLFRKNSTAVRLRWGQHCIARPLPRLPRSCAKRTFRRTELSSRETPSLIHCSRS